MAFLIQIPKSESLLQKVIQFRFLSHTSSFIVSNSTSKQQKSRDTLTLLRTENNPNRILEICRSASLTPNHHIDRIILSVAVVTLAREKHFATVSQLLDGFIQNQPNPKSESFAVRVIILYGRANMLDRSLQTFHNLEQYEIPRTVKSLNALLFACLMAKDYREAERVYSEMPKMYDMERNWIKPTAGSFGIMIAGFYREKKYDDVRKVLRMMNEFGVHVGVATYNIMIQCLCERKKSLEAKALIDGVASSRMRPNSVTYSILIHGFCSEENLDEAMNLFMSMVKSGYKPDSECYFTLIHCLCKVGDFETALILCLESMEKNWVPSFSVMKWIVNGLVSLSMVDEAKELIAHVKVKFTRNVELWKEVEAALPR